MMSNSRGGHHTVLAKNWQGPSNARSHIGSNIHIRGITWRLHVVRGASCCSYQGDQLLPSEGYSGQHGNTARAPGVTLFATYRIQGFGMVQAAPAAHDESLRLFSSEREEQTKLQQLDAEATVIAPQQHQQPEQPPTAPPPQQQHGLRSQQQDNKDNIWRKRANDEAAQRLKLEENVAFMKGENTALKSEIAALRDMVQVMARQQPGGSPRADNSIDMLITMLAAVSVALRSQQQDGSSSTSSSAEECCLASKPKLEVVELLQQAIEAGDVVCVKQLLASGARTDMTIPKYGASPLHLAAELGATQVCRVLLLSGADPDARARMGGATPLHLAAQHGTEDTVRCLLLAEANVNAENNDGNTPLHLAVERGDRSIINLLLTAGANKDATNKERETPYDVAVNPSRRRPMLRRLRHDRHR